ncbi:hypothetical protein P9112_009838 [Eukaryota sp. TZLM1-RC]
MLNVSLPPSQILTDLRNSPHLRDYTLRFNGEEFPIHRALLALYSKYYHKLFTLNWVDSNDPTSDYDHLPVSSYSLKIFLDYFYGGSIEFTPETFYHFRYLSSFFEVDSINEACDQVISDHFQSPEWLLPAVVNADANEDQKLLMKIGSYINSTILEPLSLSFTSLSCLVEEQQAESLWLVRSVVWSWKKNNLSDCQVEKLLGMIDSEELKIEELYEDVFLSFYQQSQFNEFLFEFSIKYFKNNSQIPPKWFFWVLKMANEKQIHLAFLSSF